MWCQNICFELGHFFPYWFRESTWPVNHICTHRVANPSEWRRNREGAERTGTFFPGCLVSKCCSFLLSLFTAFSSHRQHLLTRRALDRLIRLAEGHSLSHELFRVFYFSHISSAHSTASESPPHVGSPSQGRGPET